MASGVLRSFLVSIGYKVDQSSERHFTDSISKATLNARLLGDVIEETARRLVTAVTSMATGFEDLYYASQRTNTSAQNIRALGYAVSQLGGSYESAVASLEEFSRKLRDNPGYEGMLKDLGIRTREANGSMRESLALFTDLGELFRSQPYEIANQYRQALGIDETTFRILREQPAALAKYREEFKRTSDQLGLNLEESTERSKDLNQSLRSLWMTVTVAAQKLLSDLTPALTAIIDKFRDWLASNPDRLNRIIEALGEALRRFGAAALEAMEKLTPFLEKMAQGGDDLQKSGSFLDTVNKTITGLRVLVEWIEKLVGWFNVLLGVADKLDEKFGLGRLMGMLEGGPGAGGGGDANTHTNDTGSGAAGALRRGWGKVKGWFGGNNGGGEGGGSGTTAPAPEAEGKYRPVYKLTDADTHDRVLDTIASEARMKDPASVDAVINNMLNRVGSKGWGPSGNLLEVSQAPGQYEGAWKGRKATEQEKAYLKKRIAEIASGGVPSNVGDADTFRASGYGSAETSEWYRKHGQYGKVVGGNRYASTGVVGPYVPYQEPKADPPKPEPAPPPTQAPLPSFDFSRVPRVDPSMLSSSNDNSKNITVHQNNRTEVSVTGVSDPVAAGSAVAGQQERVNTLSLRNAQGALR